MYDPYVQRFLSPDPIVKEPDNAQNYNRYSYCLNNPLKYTDPSGYSGEPAVREQVSSLSSMYPTLFGSFLSSTNFIFLPVNEYMVSGVRPASSYCTPYGYMGSLQDAMNQAKQFNYVELNVGKKEGYVYDSRRGQYGNYVQFNAGPEKGDNDTKISENTYIDATGVGLKWVPQSTGGGFSIENIYYGTPESQLITTIGSTAGFYSKMNQILSNDLAKKIAPIVHRHWGIPTMPILKYSKFAPYVGWPADILSILGGWNNGRNFGWSTEHKLDLTFSTIGLIPGYGDVASFFYMGGKDAYSLLTQFWEVTKDGVYRFEQSLPTLTSRYGR